MSKKDIADHLTATWGEEVTVNVRANTTSNGLQLADTHYTNVEVTDGEKVARKKPACFVYVFGTDEGNTLVLIKTTEEHAEALRKEHANVAPSASWGSELDK